MSLKLNTTVETESFLLKCCCPLSQPCAACLLPLEVKHLIPLSSLACQSYFPLFVPLPSWGLHKIVDCRAAPGLSTVLPATSCTAAPLSSPSCPSVTGSVGQWEVAGMSSDQLWLTGVFVAGIVPFGVAGWFVDIVQHIIVFQLKQGHQLAVGSWAVELIQQMDKWPFCIAPFCPTAFTGMLSNVEHLHTCFPSPLACIPFACALSRFTWKAFGPTWQKTHYTVYW